MATAAERFMMFMPGFKVIDSYTANNDRDFSIVEYDGKYMMLWHTANDFGSRFVDFDGRLLAKCAVQVRDAHTNPDAIRRTYTYLVEKLKKMPCLHTADDIPIVISKHVLPDTWPRRELRYEKKND